jgi:hypothetical protein
MTATLNKDMQLVSEWVARNKLALNIYTTKIRNKLALNIYTTKIIVFGPNDSLNPKPQQHLVMNNVNIEQVEVTKLLGVTLYYNYHGQNMVIQQ